MLPAISHRGTNVAAAEWDIKITNKDGKDFETNGVIMIDIKIAKQFVYAIIFLT